MQTCQLETVTGWGQRSQTFLYIVFVPNLSTFNGHFSDYWTNHLCFNGHLRWVLSTEDKCDLKLWAYAILQAIIEGQNNLITIPSLMLT